MAEQPPSWLEEILRFAGDISRATADAIQRAAEYDYQLYGGQGEAWALYYAREAAKRVLTAAATSSDPDVKAAVGKYEQAAGHAARLLAGGPEGTVDLDTPEGLAASAAGRVAQDLEEKSSGVVFAATEWHSSRIGQAWRTADMDFVASHSAELQSADPERYESILEGFRKDAWLEEILRAAGDISPATELDIRTAAEHDYQQRDEGRGEAWGVYAARQAAKSVLADAATEADLAATAVLRVDQDARGRADHTADALHAWYSATWDAARARHYAEIAREWRAGDLAFLRAHRDELEAADPESLKNILATCGEDAGTASVAGEPCSGPSGRARAVSAAAGKPGEAEEGSGARRTPQALAADSFPQNLPQGLRPSPSAGASSGQSSRSTARVRPDQSLRAARGGGRQ